MTIYHVYAADAYEIILTTDNMIQEIILYRRCKNTLGESVRFDDLPASLQDEIIQKINNIKEEND